MRELPLLLLLLLTGLLECLPLFAGVVVALELLLVALLDDLLALVEAFVDQVVQVLLPLLKDGVSGDGGFLLGGRRGLLGFGDPAEIELLGGAFIELLVEAVRDLQNLTLRVVQVPQVTLRAAPEGALAVFEVAEGGHLAELLLGGALSGGCGLRPLGHAIDIVELFLGVVFLDLEAVRAVGEDREAVAFCYLLAEGLLLLEFFEGKLDISLRGRLVALLLGGLVDLLDAIQLAPRSSRVKILLISLLRVALGLTLQDLLLLLLQLLLLVGVHLIENLVDLEAIEGVFIEEAGDERDEIQGIALLESLDSFPDLIEVDLGLASRLRPAVEFLAPLETRGLEEQHAERPEVSLDAELFSLDDLGSQETVLVLEDVFDLLDKLAAEDELVGDFDVFVLAKYDIFCPEVSVDEAVVVQRLESLQHQLERIEDFLLRPVAVGGDSLQNLLLEVYEGCLVKKPKFFLLRVHAPNGFVRQSERVLLVQKNHMNIYQRIRGNGSSDLYYTPEVLVRDELRDSKLLVDRLRSRLLILKQEMGRKTLHYLIILKRIHLLG